MPIARAHGIQRKLTVSHMVASTLALLVACGAIMTWEFFRYRSELRNTIGIQAQIVGANSASAILFRDTKSASETLAALRVEPGIERAYIFDVSGRVFARFDRRRSADVADPRRPAADGEQFQDGRMILSRPIASEGEQIGHIVLYVSLDLVRRKLVQYC